MPRLTSCLAALYLFSAVAAPAHAWGKTGHRVTGAIAQVHLSPDSAAAVADLLGAEDLAEASTWPDFMRASPEVYWQRQAGPWHYVTVPRGLTYQEAGTPAEGDALSALEAFRETLLNPQSPRDEKVLALRFTVHIIGDLHQPLHVGNGTDRGGNDVRVSFFRTPTNLHSVWDSKMIDHEQLSYTELADWLLRDLSADEISRWTETDPEVWVAESAALRDQIYPDGTDLSWDYVFAHRATYRIRLQQAGLRLAAYLNEVFASPAP